MGEAMTKEQLDATKALIRKALQFSDWAAGEGIAPANGQPADAPDDFLVEYSDATGDTDWETLPERIPALLDAIDAAEAKMGVGEPVAVKPLQWAIDKASSILGTYKIDLNAGGWAWSVEGRVPPSWPFPTIALAKAAAETHYVECVRSALVASDGSA